MQKKHLEFSIKAYLSIFLNVCFEPKYDAQIHMHVKNHHHHCMIYLIFNYSFFLD